MCDFISWIEKGDALLYLTDSEIFSARGRKMSNACKDNDFIGHGAIRKFYGVSPENGIEKEIRDFWNTEKLPSELAEQAKEFDKHWSRTFQNYFQNNDLCYIITNVPNHGKRRLVV